MLRGSDGAQACVTVTLLDGLVLARSAFHHSMNYRSVVLFGQARRIDDEAEKRRAFDAFVEKAVPGRAAVARGADANELRSTLVLGLDISEGSLRVRTGPLTRALSYLHRRAFASSQEQNGQGPELADGSGAGGDKGF